MKRRATERQLVWKIVRGNRGICQRITGSREAAKNQGEEKEERIINSAEMECYGKLLYLAAISPGQR